VGIGLSIFLFVMGAILTFAVELDTGSGFDLNTVGIILMVGGLLGLLVSALFWSSFSLRWPVASAPRVRFGQGGSRAPTASRPTGLVS
jgi:uncharacterized protein DUF6458